MAPRNVRRRHGATSPHSSCQEQGIPLKRYEVDESASSLTSSHCCNWVTSVENALQCLFGLAGRRRWNGAGPGPHHRHPGRRAPHRRVGVVNCLPRSRPGRRLSSPSSSRPVRTARCVMRTDGHAYCPALGSTATSPGAGTPVPDSRVSASASLFSKSSACSTSDEGPQHRVSGSSVRRADGQPPRLGSDVTVQRQGCDGRSPASRCRLTQASVNGGTAAVSSWLVTVPPHHRAAARAIEAALSELLAYVAWDVTPSP